DVSIEDDGTVYVSATSGEAADAAIDLFNGCICGFTGSSGDIDGAVVFDRHICAGFFRDGVDGLALRANQLTDLGYWNLDRGDLRCQWRHLIWSVNALGHDVQDLFAGIACLR